MVGAGLKKFAVAKGLEVSNGVAFGIIGDYMFTLDEGSGFKRIRAGAFFSEAIKRDTLMTRLLNLKKEYKIRGTSTSDSYVEVVLIDTFGTMKRLENFIDRFIELLRESEAFGISNCWFCGGALDAQASEKVMIDGAVLPMHTGCIDTFERKMATASDEFKFENKNYGRGILGAIIGGILGAIPWAVVYALGYFVGWLGYIMGWMIKKGYERAGGKPGVGKLIIVLLTIIPTVLLGIFLGDVIQVIWYMIRGEITGISMLQIPSLIYITLLEDPVYRDSIIKNIGVGFFFALLGVYSLLAELKKESRGGVSRIVRLK